MKITNNAKGLQGIHTTKGVVYLKPGQTRDDLELDDASAKRAKALSFLTVEGEAADETEVSADRDDLKAQAKELGLEYPRNITTEKLKELVDAKLAS